jgi:hypothetical protein
MRVVSIPLPNFQEWQLDLDGGSAFTAFNHTISS